MTGVYVALGANLDSPERQLDSACLALQQLARQDSFRVSSYYRSVPMGDVPQPDYVNAVAYFETELAPLELLDALQEIELQQGRQRLVRWGPELWIWTCCSTAISRYRPQGSQCPTTASRAASLSSFHWKSSILRWCCPAAPA